MVAGVGSGESALNLIPTFEPELITLELMLPGIDGIEVCRRLRDDPHSSSIAILVLTSSTHDQHAVSALEAGANDYMMKPFNVLVLVARIRAILRSVRSTAQRAAPQDEMDLHGIRIDVRRHQVFVDGEEIHLSTTEFDILTFLARNPGWVFSRSDIIDAVRGKEATVTERAVDVQILGLRRRLGAKGAHIQTVRGVGYRLEG